ncbi:hypothetical protein DL96DRAFT_120317 [Flagelloscypha sp. PMI_526]|nr:hypothetical protein DL96DRAFT_120317 [Flagelloscypha sp. PMI_526]
MQRSGVGIGRAIDPHQYAAYSRGRTPATIYTNVPNLSLINTHTPLSPAPRRGLPTFRRPHTPLSSSPLREDFDEYTNTRPDRSTAVFDPPTVHSPVAEDFDAPTTTRPTTTMEQEEDEDVEAQLVGRRMVLPRPPRATQPPQPPPPIAGPSRGYGYGRGHTRNLSEGSPLPRPTRPTHPPSSFSPPARHKEVLDDYEDYDQFLDETDRVFRAGSYAQNSRATLTTSLSLALSRRRPASSSTRQEQQEPQTIDSQSISHSYIPERPSNPLLEGMGTTTVPTTKTDSQTNSGFGEVIQRSASLVDRRYSTFRRSPNSKTEFAMVDNTVVAQDAERTVEVSAWREQVAREAVDGNQRMSVYYVMQNDVLEVGRGAFREIKVDQMEEEIVETYLDYQPQSRPTAQRMRSFSTGSMDDFRPLRTSSPYPFKTTTQVRPRPTHGQGYDRARRRGAPPTPPRSQNNGTPRTGSSPLSLGYSSNSRRSKERGRMMSLEDVARQPSSPPDPKPSPFIESILADCEPSLTHLGPILAKLGITTEAHLLAVMKLRGETRDREVREEALRLGITIVEWAVFVDKLLSWF